VRIARPVLVLLTDSELVGELLAASPLTVMHEQLNANNDLSEQQI